ncbi:MAG TPA: hypothetical protein VFS67_28595 [Polyangiaceae bacterium]|nr:hypothetical protein [Polyangiaceae bacterium]
MRIKVATRPAAVGTTWLDLFQPGAPSELTLEARVRVIADVAGALVQIHENSGIPRPHRRHGRLTPRHILITVDGSACLFHVKEPFSRLLPPQPDLGYLAPELLTQSSSANQQCDVFSLGVLLWEALDNGRLFPHRRAAAISRLSSRSLPAPRASEEWALPLCDVALRALSREPAERYADATAFWLALREHLPSPEAGRAALSRLVQAALKLELTSEIREAPPYLVPNALASLSRPPEGPESALLGPEAARYSLQPEPSSRRLHSRAASFIPDAPDPAWLLSDPPPASSRSNSGVEAIEPAARSDQPRSVEQAAAELPGSAEPARKPQLAEPPDKQERPRTSKRPNAGPPLSTLRMNLQRELVDNSLPFFVASQPAARPFPWGALSFAALIFFGVGAAVAFGAVSALRASRSEVVVHERAIVDPTPSAAELARTAAAPAAAPPPSAPAAAAPGTPGAPSSPAPSPAPASKAPEPRPEPARKAPAPRRALAKPRPRPVPVRSTSQQERSRDAREPAQQELENLPFTNQPY